MKMQKILALGLAVLAGSLWHAGHVLGQSQGLQAIQFFSQATVAYKSGNYAQAIDRYEEILKKRWESGALYYNLGNSYFKSQKLGKAILNYERAKLLMPRDSDLKSNSFYAESLIQGYESPQDSHWLVRWVEHFKNSFTLDELVLALSLMMIVLGAISLARIYGKWPLPLTWISGGALVAVSIFTLFIFFQKLNEVKTSFVMIASTQAYYEPRENATVYFELPEGTKVFMVKLEGDWAKIRRWDRKIGWVKKEALEKI